MLLRHGAMKRILQLWLVSLVMPAAFAIASRRAIAAGLGAAQKSAICQGRSSCSAGKLFDGGKSRSGALLTVVEVHLGLKDKPDDAPDDGCHADDGRDGGVEYGCWTAPPSRRGGF